MALKERNLWNDINRSHLPHQKKTQKNTPNFPSCRLLASSIFGWCEFDINCNTKIISSFYFRHRFFFSSSFIFPTAYSAHSCIRWIESNTLNIRKQKLRVNFEFFFCFSLKLITCDVRNLFSHLVCPATLRHSINIFHISHYIIVIPTHMSRVC